jgi:signal transduction histidine kinase
VEGLLDLAKHRPLEKRAVDINAILDEDVSVMRQQFQAEGKKIVSHYDRNIPHVSVDINQIRQVFINLMINALEALQHGGCLTIATKYLPARKQVHITFKDEGVGVPAHIRSRIFEPFFSTKSDGVGLGLAISQGIVISHGGSIEVEDHPHKGAVFTVILPVSTFLSQDDV